MSNVSYDSLSVGDEISAVNKPAISRHTVALYCGGSGDHNPIHVDSDFAKAAGMPDVFAHSMLSMAYLGQALTGWVPQSALHSYGVRFASITWVEMNSPAAAPLPKNSRKTVKNACGWRLKRPTRTATSN